MINRNKIRTKVVQLKPGKYELRIETQPDADGIKHQRVRKVKAASRSSAERKLREFIAEVLQEEPVTQKVKDNKNMTVSTLLDLFISDMELSGRAAKTMENYKNRRKRIDEAFKNRTISELTVQRIDSFSKALTEATNRHDEYALYKNMKGKTEVRKLSKDTAYRIQALLIQAIKWGDKKGYLMDNITHRLTKLPKSPYTQIEIPDIDSIINFMDYMNNDDTVMLNTKVFFNLAVWTGMRTEELLALTWDDVNFQTKRIRVTKAVVRVGGSTRVQKEPKSKSSVRDVIVPEKVIGLLNTWNEFCKASFPKWLENRPYLEKYRNYVIVNQTDGTLPNPGTFNQWLRRYLERHEFEHGTPHGLRHFFTTYLLVKGADVKTVSKLMGHSKTATTLNIYAALTKEGYDKVESILNGTNNE